MRGFAIIAHVFAPHIWKLCAQQTMINKNKLLRYYLAQLEIFFALVSAFISLIQLLNYDTYTAVKVFIYCFAFLQVPIALMCFRYYRSLSKDGF